MSAGALPPDVPSSYVGLADLSLFMAVSQLSVCMCLMLGLACIVLYCFHGCAAYVLHIRAMIRACKALQVNFLTKSGVSRRVVSK